jgi:hypothetical protein
LAFAGAFVGLLRWGLRGKTAAPAPLETGAACDCDRTAIAQALQFGLIAGFSLLSAYAKALYEYTTFGGIITPSYYLIPGFPSLLALAFIALGGFGSRRLWFAGVSGLGCLFIATECHSLFAVALPYWSSSHDLVVIWRRAVSTHPVFPGPWAAPGLALMLCALVTVVLRQVWTADRRETCLPPSGDPAR